MSLSEQQQPEVSVILPVPLLSPLPEPASLRRVPEAGSKLQPLVTPCSWVMNASIGNSVKAAASETTERHHHHHHHANKAH